MEGGSPQMEKNWNVHILDLFKNYVVPAQHIDYLFKQLWGTTAYASYLSQ
jgi:hypothetical protein